MDGAGDKMATNAGTEPAKRSKTRSSKGRKKQAPFQKVKAGSAVVPIYRTESKGRTRFTVSFYRDGRRVRKSFADPDEARKEAQFVAQRIQTGMQHVTDLKPHERDAFKAAEALLRKIGIPLVAAVEDYVRARELAGTESLAAMAAEYGQHFRKVVRQVTIPRIVDEMLLQREQDGASKDYLGQLRTTLKRFAAQFPGAILEVSSQQIDAWLRSLPVAATTRNSMLRCIKVFFSFARSRNYLPEDRSTAAQPLRLPHRDREERRPGGPRSWQLAKHHLPGLPRADHRGCGQPLVRDPAEVSRLRIGPPRQNGYVTRHLRRGAESTEGSAKGFQRKEHS